MQSISDALENFISEEDFLAMQSIIQSDLDSRGVSLGALAGEIRISRTNLSTFLRRRDKTDDKPNRGQTVSYVDVKLPVLKYIYDNCDRLAKLMGGNDEQSLLARCLSERQERNPALVADEAMMRDYFDFEGELEDCPTSVQGMYFGYRISSRSNTRDLDSIQLIRFFQKIWVPDGAKIARFGNIYDGGLHGERHTCGLALYFTKRLFLSGATVRVGSKDAPLMRKSFILESTGNRLLRGVVSTTTASSQQIICRTLLVPVEQHEGVTVHDADRLDAIKVDIGEKKPGQSIGSFTGLTSLENALLHLPESYASDVEGLLSVITNDIDPAHHVFFVNGQTR